MIGSTKDGIDGAGSDADLERRHDDALARGREAAARKDFAAQVACGEEAIAVCRTLVERHPGDDRHLAVLAADLYNHAGHLLAAQRAAQVREVLDEAQRHYTALAARDPREYAVRACDVQLRAALALHMQHNYEPALGAARAALAAYEAVTAGDLTERDFGVLRAHTLIGRSLLASGQADAALADFDKALFAGERLRETAGIAGTDYDWLARAPESFRMAAPTWLGAAVAAMELHDAAGNFAIAADAANIAMRVAGGLAPLGGDAAVRRFEAIMARAQEIWAAANNPMQAALQRGGPTSRFRISGAGGGPRVAPNLARISVLAGWA